MEMSSLINVAVNVKQIERQRLVTCFLVFCDKTANAVVHHPKKGKKSSSTVTETVLFMKLLSRWWRILNVKQKGLCVSLQGINYSVNDYSLTKKKCENISNIEVVEELKYLGVIVQAKRNVFEGQKNEMIKKSKD